MSTTMPNVEALVGLFDPSPHLTPLERVRGCQELLAQYDTKAYEKQIQRRSRCVAADTAGNVEYEMDVEEWMCNDRKVMHGACGSLLIEGMTWASVLVFATPGFWALPTNPVVPNKAHFAGVTRHLNVTWCAMASLGTKLRIKSRLLQLSARQAVMRCEVFDEETGKLLFFGEHDATSVAANPKAVAEMAAGVRNREKKKGEEKL